MAKQLNVNLAFTADTTQAKAQMKQLQQELNNLTSSLQGKQSMGKDMGITKDINSALTATSKLKLALSQAFDSSTGKLDLSQFNNSLERSGTSLKKIQNLYSQTGTEGQRAFLNLSNSILTAEKPVSRINAGLKEMAVSLKNTARWQISSSVLHGFMGALSSAYGYAKDLNKSLNNIRIVTGQSVEQMDKFAEKANKAAKALSTTTTQYTDAALIFYQQGLGDKEVEERTNATIKMANVTGDAVTEVSSYMTAIWNNFDDGSQSLEHYADVITALGASTASSSAEIAAGIEKFAAIGETVGLSYDYATSALATVVAETRQSADVVGTAFKTIFSRMEGLKLGETLEDGTDLNKYSQALQSVGISIKDQAGQLRDMDDILDDMGAKWQTLARDQKVALAQSVAGVRQYNQMISLMDNWDVFENNLNTAKNSDGSLQQQADIYAESWEAARDRVKAAAQSIYSDLLDDDFFIKLLDSIEKVLSFVDNLIDSMGGLRGVVAAVGTVIFSLFSKEIGKSLNNAIYNIKVLTGTAKKEWVALQQETQKYQQNIINEMSKNVELSATDEISLQTAKETQKIQGVIAANEKKLTGEKQKQINILKQEYNSLVAQNKARATALDEVEKQLQEELKLQKEQQTGNATEKEKEKTEKRINSLLEQQSKLQGELLDGEVAQKIEAERVSAAIQKIADQKLSTGEIFSYAASGISSLIWGLSTVESLFDTLSDSSATVGEKIKASFMSATMTIPMILIGFKSLKTAYDGIGASLKAKMIAEKADMMLSTKRIAIQKIEMLWNKRNFLLIEKYLGKQAFKILQNEIENGTEIKKAVAIALATKEQEKENLSLAEMIALRLAANPAILAGAVALGVLAGAIALAVYHEQRFERAQKEAAEQQKQANEVLNDAKENYQSLLDTITNYEEAQDAIKKLTKGTDEWNEAIQNSNEEVLKLLQLYPQLANEIENIDGVLTISEKGKEDIVAAEKEKVSNAQMVASGASMRYNDAKNNNDIHNAASKITYSSSGIYKDSKTMSDTQMKTVLSAVGTYGNAIFKDADSLSAATGIKDSGLLNALISNKDAILTLNTSVQANTKANDILGEDIAYAALEGNSAYDNTGDSIKNAAAKTLASDLDPNSQAYKFAILKYNNKNDKTIQSEYAELMGWNVSSIDNKKGKGIYHFEDGSTKEISDDIARAALATAEVTENASAKIGDVIDGLESAAGAAKQLGEGLSGEEKSQMADIALGFAGGKGGSVLDADSAQVDILRELTPDSEFIVENYKTLGYESAWAFAEAITNSIAQYDDALEKITDNMGSNMAKSMYNGLEEGLSNTSVQGKQEVATALDETFEHFGTQNTAGLKDIFQSLADSGQDVGAFAEIINSIDWSAGNGPQQLTQAMEENGIVVDTSSESWMNWINDMQRASSTAMNFVNNLGSMRESLAKINDLTGDLKTGSVVSQEDYETLVGYNSEIKSMFIMTANGWQFVGDVDSLNNALKQSVGSLDQVKEKYAEINSVAKRLNKGYGDHDLAAGVDDKGNNMSDLDKKNVARDIVKSDVGDAVLDQAGMSRDSFMEQIEIANDSTKSEEERAAAMEKITSVLTAATQIQQNYNDGVYDSVNAETVWASVNIKTIDDLNNANLSAGAAAEVLISLASQYENTAAETQAFQQAENELAYAIESGDDKKQKAAQEAYNLAEAELKAATMAGEAVKKYGLEADALETQARMIQKNSKNKSMSIETAMRLAIANERMNKGVKTASENFSDWSKTLKGSNKNSKDYAKTLSDANKALADIVGAVDDSKIPFDFFDTSTKEGAEHLELLGKAAKGDVNAINKLGLETAKAGLEVEELNSSIVGIETLDGRRIKPPVDPDEFQNAKDGVVSAIDTINGKLGELKDGADLSSVLGEQGVNDFVNNLNTMALATGMSVEEMNAYLNQIGVETEVTTTPVTQMTKVPVYETTTHVVNPGDPETHDGQVVRTTTTQQGTQDMKETIEVAQIAAGDGAGKGPKLTYRGTGGSGASSGGVPKSSTGGGKGGGGGNKKDRGDKKEKKKKSDEVERYHQVNEELEDLSRVVAKAEKQTSKLFGTKQLAAYRREVSKIGDEFKKNQQKAEEANNYLIKDRKKLAGAIAESLGKKNNKKNRKAVRKDFFDKNGVLKYDDVMNVFYDEYNEAYKKYEKVYKNMPKKMGEADQKKLEAAEKELETAEKTLETQKKLIETYEESLNTREEQIQAMQNDLDSILEKNLDIINALKEQKTLLRELVDTQADYFDKKYSSTGFLDYDALVKNASGRLGNIKDKLADAYNIMTIADEKYANYQTAVGKTKGNIQNGEVNTTNYDDWKTKGNSWYNIHNWEDATISQAAWAELTTDEIKELYNALGEAIDLDAQMFEYYGETLDYAMEKMERYNTKLENNTNKLNHYRKILELTGQKKNYDMIGKTLDAQLQTSKKTYEALSLQLDTLTKQKTALEKDIERNQGDDEALKLLQHELDQVEDKIAEVEDESLSALETTAEFAKEILHNDVEKAFDTAFKTIQNGVEESYNSFEQLNNMISLTSSYQGDYVTKTNQVYEMNKLLRAVTNEMMVTDSKAAKMKYAAFADEIENLREVDELTSTELEIAKAKYEVLKAQIALEDAQNAKSTVRLSRDSEGNYGYVYTADQKAVDDAEQKLDDARNRLYNIKLDAANKYSEQIIQLQEEELQAYKDILDDEEKTTEEKQEEIAQLQEEYYRKRNLLIHNYNDALADDFGVGVQVLEDYWVQSYANQMQTTEEWETTTSKFISDGLTAAKTYASTLSTDVTKPVEDDFGKMSTAIDGVKKDNEALVKELKDNVKPTLDDTLESVRKTTTAWAEQRKELAKLLPIYETIAKTKISEITAATGDAGDHTAGAKTNQEVWNAYIAQSDSAKAKSTAGYLHTYNKDSFNTWYEKNKANYSSKDKALTAYIDEHYGLNEGKNAQRLAKMTSGAAGTDKDENTYYWYFFDPDTHEMHYAATKYAGTTSASAKKYFKKKYSNFTNNTKVYYAKDERLAASLDTGGYTGDWGSKEGRLAMLHEKELVLNQDDTRNILTSVGILRDLLTAIDTNAAFAQLGLGGLSPVIATSSDNSLNQNVTITAQFPNATNHSEIEEAFNNLINRASQYANRR